MNTITQAVAQRISEISDDVNARVIEHYKDLEADRRAKAIIAGIDKIDTLEKDLRKAKPDQVLFDADGKEISAGYSKEKLDARNKLNEQIAKLAKALDKAIGGEMGDLLNAVKQ